MSRTIACLLVAVVASGGCVLPSPPPSAPQFWSWWERAGQELGWDLAGAWVLELEATFAPGQAAFRTVRLVFCRPAAAGYDRNVLTWEGTGVRGTVTAAGPAEPGAGPARIAVAELFRAIDAAGITAEALPNGEYTRLWLDLQAGAGRLQGPSPGSMLATATGCRALDPRAPVANVGPVAAIVRLRPVRGGSGVGQDFLLEGLSGGVVSAPAPGPGPDGWRLEASYYADLDADGRRELLVLVLPDAPPFSGPGHQRLLITDERGQVAIAVGADTPGYGTRLTLADLDADGRPELLLNDIIGGSGSIEELRVYSLERTAGGWEARPAWTAMAALQDATVTYLGDGRVRLESERPHRSWEYAAYEPGDGAEESARHAALAGGKGHLDPYSSFALTDTDGDGTLEIIARQRLSGQAHADVIGLLSTVFGWEDRRARPREVHLHAPGPAGWTWVPPLGP